MTQALRFVITGDGQTHAAPSREAAVELLDRLAIEFPEIEWSVEALPVEPVNPERLGPILNRIMEAAEVQRRVIARARP